MNRHSTATDDADFDPFNLDVVIPFPREQSVTDPSIPDVVDEDDALGELRSEVTDAIDYMSEFADEWEDAQQYYDGESALPKVEGRSQAVHTAVRNAVRGAKPSLMRIFMSTGSIVEYMPHTRLSAATAAAQTQYVNQLFVRAGGYTIMSDLIQNASLKMIGPVKWYFKVTKTPRYINLTGLMDTEYAQLQAHPNAKILSVEPRSLSLEDVTPDAPMGATSLTVYDCEVAYIEQGGEICIESIPLPNFFISRNATSCDDARVCGSEQDARVGDLMQLGIPYSLLEDLDEYDPETSGPASGEATARRKTNKQQENTTTDPMMKKVLVTEVYARFDLDGLGAPQLWRFLLGGTERVLLKRERATRVQMCLARIDFIPHTAIGGSLYQISKQDQNSITSVLRGTIDNLHMSNNRRLAVHENLVNMADLMSPKIGAPIRVRAAGQIQEIGVQSQIGASLPFLQYLGSQSENRVGVTAAAMGLDPDALQSTDKDAVRNTIQLSQGQIELMARNLAQSLVPLFQGLLELSTQHLGRFQTAGAGQASTPIDQMLFDPTLFMQPKVGLGTNDIEAQRANLATIITTQTGMMDKYGPNNPFCDLSHVSNAIEDLCKLSNIHNVDRYFKYVDAPTGAALAQQATQAAAQAAQEAKAAPNPIQAMLDAEGIKATSQENQAKIRAIAEARNKSLELQFNALTANAKDDLERDKLAQMLWVEQAKLFGQYAIQPKIDKLKMEQAAPRAPVA